MNSSQTLSRFHRPHPSITRSHRQLIKAVKIWKMPFLNSSNVIKPRPFKERLKCVEMHRKSSEVSTPPKSISCFIRDLQLCSSDSSPSPFNSPVESRDTRRRRPVYTRQYRKQLQWYHTLSKNKRPRHKPQELNLEGQRSHTDLNVTDEFCLSVCHVRKRHQRSSLSAQSPPEFQTPARKTSRRLWRRQLDTSSSDSSRSTNTTPADVKNRRPTQNNITSSKLNRKTSWTEFNFLEIHSDSITEASQKSLSVMSKKDQRKDSSATKASVQTSDVTDEKIKTSQRTQKSRNKNMKLDKRQKIEKNKPREDRDETTSELTNSVSSSQTTVPSQKNKQMTDIKISNTEKDKQQVVFKIPSFKTKLRGLKHTDSAQNIKTSSEKPHTPRSKISSGKHTQ